MLLDKRQRVLKANKFIENNAINSYKTHKNDIIS